MKRAGSPVLSLLSVVLVGLTGLTVLCYLIVLVNPYVFFNPFPPPRPGGVSMAPTPTSPPVLQPTYTPSSTPTRTPTPLPTPTRTPTGTPTITPTWPPTPTRTPRVTRAPYPFTCEVTYRANPYNMPWSGVAGHVEDLDGNPLPGYRAQVGCPGVPRALDGVAGASERYNLMYENQAAWEVACNPSAYVVMEIRVQLHRDQPDGTSVAVSDIVVAELGDWAARSLGYVVCTLNWEGWQ